MAYTHTQKSPLFWLVLAVGVICLVPVPSEGRSMLTTMLVLAAMVFVLLAFCFRSLSVSGGPEVLSVRFGPIPLFGTSINYEDIEQVESGSSAIIDGWGIHYIPTRGWTYNLWGFHCAIIRTRRTTFRIGSDDVDNLVAFLKHKIESLN